MRLTAMAFSLVACCVLAFLIGEMAYFAYTRPITCLSRESIPPYFCYWYLSYYVELARFAVPLVLAFGTSLYCLILALGSQP